MSLILGIDPGSRKTGFGILDQVGTRLRYISSGVIRVDQQPSLPTRLKVIFNSLVAIIEEHQPHAMAIEQVFIGRSAAAALKLGQARGVAILAGAASGLEVFEYAPRKVKQAVAGVGNADKKQVAYMVQQLLQLPGAVQEDAADALAVAICHSFTAGGLLAGKPTNLLFESLSPD